MSPGPAIKGPALSINRAATRITRVESSEGEQREEKESGERKKLCVCVCEQRGGRVCLLYHHHKYPVQKV